MGEYDTFVLRYASALAIVLFKSIYSPFIIWLSAYFSYLPLRLMFDARFTGNIIWLGQKSIEYVEACSATGAYMFLALLIFLTNGVSFKKGIKIFYWGALFILAANVIRINILAYLLVAENINLFLTLHLLTWKILSGVFVAFIWILLVKKFNIKGIPIVDDFVFLKNKLLY